MIIIHSYINTILNKKKPNDVTVNLGNIDNLRKQNIILKFNYLFENNFLNYY